MTWSDPQRCQGSTETRIVHASGAVVLRVEGPRYVAFSRKQDGVAACVGAYEDVDRAKRAALGEIRPWSM